MKGDYGTVNNIFCPEHLLTQDILDDYTEEILDAIRIVSEPEDTFSKDLVIEGLPNMFWVSIHREPLYENQFEVFSRSMIGVSLVNKDVPFLSFIVDVSEKDWQKEAYENISAIIKIAHLPQFRERML